VLLAECERWTGLIILDERGRCGAGEFGVEDGEDGGDVPDEVELDDGAPGAALVLPRLAGVRELEVCLGPCVSADRGQVDMDNVLLRVVDLPATGRIHQYLSQLHSQGVF
jgi:hypothetical protein